ncbi:hypothetical protein D3C75_1210200 [compost metagenome]
MRFLASLCTMLVSAQPVTPSLGTVVAMGCLSAIRVLAWNGQEPEATTPSFLKSSIWTKASCQ